MQAAKTTLKRKRRHFGIGCRKTPKNEKEPMGIMRVAGLAYDRLLMIVGIIVRGMGSLGMGSLVRTTSAA
jgi:hypothetical protein